MNQEQDTIMDNISRLERELNLHLTKAGYRMEEIRMARQEVTDPGMIRRGWGWDPEMAIFQEMAETVVYDIKSHITEYGGGCTTEQSERLGKVIKAVASPQEPVLTKEYIDILLHQLDAGERTATSFHENLRAWSQGQEQHQKLRMSMESGQTPGKSEPESARMSMDYLRELVSIHDCGGEPNDWFIEQIRQHVGDKPPIDPEAALQDADDEAAWIRSLQP